ncbi:MAG TPA: MmgE/PrpD family protein [Candidatus Dormibacteraeota bacterium]|nr:MmgE/PrpD family protein [Candidatus Dormibacteraeota bacterium]
MAEVAGKLAEYATGLRYPDLSPPAVEKAKQLFLDLVGIALCAGATADSTPAVRDAVLALGGAGEASLIGEGRTLHPAWAAFLNGAYAHSLDADDTHRRGSVHPGAAVVPTVLALAEQHRLDGRRLLAAMVVGYDVTCRLAMAVGPGSHYGRGFHPTATCGVFGATAAGANLLGLSVGALRDAFGINLSQSAGSLEFLADGAWTKRIHPGLAAHGAVLALELAARGFRGPRDPFEGPRGFFHAYTDAARPELAVEGLGDRFEILATAIKPYPSCRYSHGPLDLIIRLARENRIRPEEVEWVRVGMSDVAVDIIGRPIERKRAPENVVDGQFSMPFLAAAALARGGMGWTDYELIGDPSLRPLMQKVEVVASEEANRVFPEQWLAEVEIRARGQVFADRTWVVKGEPEAPLSWGEVEAKFDGLAAARLPDPGRRRHLVEAIRELDRVADLRQLGSLLRLEAATRVG